VADQPARKPRTKQDPAKRAQQGVEKAEKALDKANERVVKAREELANAQAAADRASRELTYAQAHPELQPVQQPNVPDGDAPSGETPGTGSPA
jgi:chromosome segregation ATPase